MKTITLIVVAILCYLPAQASEKPAKDSLQGKEYSFIFQDSPSLISTMRQSNENLLSMYRLGVHALNYSVPSYISTTLQLVGSLLFQPLTHEEGHRSILSANGIGSISMPYFNKQGSAYVKGVSDQTLQTLRSNDLKTYIRLHTAGLESDYALWCRESNLIYEQKEKFKTLRVELLYRKITIMSYYIYGLLGANINLVEEPNELDRDIVGHDVYGAIKNFYRPNETFYRYTDFRNLTLTEQKYARRVGLLSLLNLVDPLLYNKTSKPIIGNNGLRFALGYGMCPFGDYVDERFWWKKNGFLTEFYLREYQNRTNIFPEFGLRLPKFLSKGRFRSDLNLTAWPQPKNLLFDATTYKLGGSADLRIQYIYQPQNFSLANALSIDLGIVAKTQGFMLEEVVMDKHFGLRLGASIWW